MQKFLRAISWHLLVVLLSVILLNSCAVTPTPTEKPAKPPAPQATYPEDLRGAQLYEVDAAASSVNILVYRGGTMAKMGHNHVISSTSISGYIWRGSTLDVSGFDIVVPVNELIVDEDAARTAQGTEFPLNIPDQARQDTKHNMLSQSVLDGARYPTISIKSIAMSGAADTPQVRAALTIRDQTHELMVPVTVKPRDSQLQVKGEFKILQSGFGITPFSVAMGALHVVDELTIKFDLVARQAES